MNRERSGRPNKRIMYESYVGQQDAFDIAAEETKRHKSCFPSLAQKLRREGFLDLPKISVNGGDRHIIVYNCLHIDILEKVALVFDERELSYGFVTESRKAFWRERLGLIGLVVDGGSN